MNIDTNRVKNYKFNAPIKSSIQKYSQEYRALATLRYLQPEKFGQMFKGEIPDLQDYANSIGVEITVSVREEDVKVARAFAEKYDDESLREIIESNGYSLVDLQGRRVIDTLGTGDSERNRFCKSIQMKKKRIAEYKKSFKNVGLAMLLLDPPTSHAEENFIKWILKFRSDHEENFDFFYIISHRFCIYFDPYTDEYNKYIITSEESRLLSTIGRMTAEGELKLTDAEWL